MHTHTGSSSTLDKAPSEAPSLICNMGKEPPAQGLHGTHSALMCFLPQLCSLSGKGTQASPAQCWEVSTYGELSIQGMALLGHRGEVGLLWAWTFPPQGR